MNKCYPKEELYNQSEQRCFDGTCSEAAFLLGGIGTGNVSVGSRGQLRDWEIFGTSGKGNYMPNTFFSIYTKSADGATQCKVLDAAVSNITVLRSNTCFRLSDGTLMGWEGCFDDEGCCEGNCTHVWNYAHTVAFQSPNSIINSTFFAALLAGKEMAKAIGNQESAARYDATFIKGSAAMDAMLWDESAGTVSFHPPLGGDTFSCFFSTGKNWGIYSRKNGEETLNILYGDPDGVRLL